MFNEQVILTDFKNNLSKVVEFIRTDLQALRTGKTSPSLVEGLIIETYNGTMKLSLRELATIGTEGPSTLMISPFDPSTISDIEKAILTSPLNLQPLVEGKNIRIKIPPLTEDQRKSILKLVNQKIEEGKEKIRYERDDIRKQIKASQENKEISEDEKFKIEKDIDKMSQDATALLEETKAKKEKEVMEI